MPSFTTIINNPSDTFKQSDVQSIGESMAGMSRKKDAIIATPSGSMPFVTMEGLKETPAAPGALEVLAICKALAIAPIAGAMKGPIIGPQNCPDVNASGIEVRFVFEDEGTMIVVIPDEGTLDYGLANAPMEESTSYLAAVQPGIDASFADAMQELIENEITDSALKSLLKSKVDALVESRNPAVNPLELFAQQLGSYSVRQCD